MSKGVKKVASGFNRYTPNNKFPSIHAEVDACNKLRYSRKIQHIDILVIRITKTGILSNSKPCASCTRFMRTILRKRNYLISNIFYSNQYGAITKCKLADLI